MFSISTISKRLGEILGIMDTLANAAGGDGAEDLEELNAEFEDALMLLEALDPRDEGYNEDLDGAMEALGALAGDYRTLAARLPELMEPALSLERAVIHAGDEARA